MRLQEQLQSVNVSGHGEIVQCPVVPILIGRSHCTDTLAQPAPTRLASLTRLLVVPNTILAVLDFCYCWMVLSILLTRTFHPTVLSRKLYVSLFSVSIPVSVGNFRLFPGIPFGTTRDVEYGWP